MKWIFGLMIVSLLACKEITFKEPQPKGKKALHQVPTSLRGNYLTRSDDGQLQRDTLIITARGYRFGYYDPEERLKAENEQEALLSDSLVLKHYKGYYFVNINSKPEWSLRVIRQEKNGDLQFMSMEQNDDKFKDFMKRLATDIAIDSTEVNGEKLYLIDPTPKQLIKLIEKGYFSKSGMKKVNR